MIRFVKLATALAAAAFSVTVVGQSTHSTAASESYIVRFSEPGALYFEGGIEGLEGTSLRHSQTRKFQANTPAALAYREYLLDLHDQRQDSMEALLDRPVPIEHNYHVMYSGVAVALTADEADKIRAMPGVAEVEKAGTYQLATDAGPTLIGAPAVWNGTALPPPSLPNRGEGVVIGVLDGGANSDHPSYANDASCGFSAANPKQISAVDCLSANCVGGTPEDTTNIGHGVHTASTAAGNRLVPPLNFGGVDLRWEISGVAPCGRIRHYKVCGSQNCNGAAIQAAIQQAITDQVDVVNYSISGGTNPWSTADSDRGFLDMVNADIFVAASAGNTSGTIPNPVGQVNHRGPWVLSVANSTHDRIEGHPVSAAGGPQNLPAQVAATAITSTLNAQVAVGVALGSETGCGASSPFAAGSMTGRIALIQRGGCTFVEKSNNAQAAGAVALLLYNDRGGPPIQMGATSLPAAMLGQVSGQLLRDYLLTNATAQVTVASPAIRVTDINFADVVNAGSLRGPNNSFDVTKPDITGPGTNIYAAVSDAAGQFGFLTGTSMSGPHLAGAGMLIRAAHPGWTPQEVKSALQLTALLDGLQDAASFSPVPPVIIQPWTPEDSGNGRVRVNLAVNTGLVMNETFANFLAANPATGGQPRNLNLPSLRHGSCNGSCTFTRTFRNTKTTPVTWNAILSRVPAGTQVTVTPASFTFNGGLSETQTVTIQIAITQPGGLANFGYGFIGFRATAGNLPDANLSIAVRGTSDALFANGFE